MKSNLLARVEKMERDSRVGETFELNVEQCRETACILDVLENAEHSEHYEKYVEKANNILSGFGVDHR